MDQDPMREIDGGASAGLEKAVVAQSTMRVIPKHTCQHPEPRSDALAIEGICFLLFVPLHFLSIVCLFCLRHFFVQLIVFLHQSLFHSIPYCFSFSGLKDMKSNIGNVMYGFNPSFTFLT